MGFAVWRLSIALGLGLAGGSAPRAFAEEWAAAAVSADVFYETDVSTLVVKDRVVRSWTRETTAGPRRDELNHKPYVVSTIQRSDDCEARRYAFGSVVRYDARGVVVSTASSGTGWTDVVPGSVGEAIWRTNCAAAQPIKEEPFLESLTAGEWRSLGRSVDGKYTLSVRLDQVVRLDADHVLTVARSEYAKPEWIDGFGVRVIVTAQVIDCTKEASAGGGLDAYVSPRLRVKALRVPREQLKYEPMAPASFLAQGLKQLCGSAQPSQPKAQAEGGTVFTGTAWGVDKGYLATAAHVIEDAKAIAVYRDGEKVGEARVVAADYANDLAVLAFTRRSPGKLKVLPLAPRTATLGAGVFTLGYPAPEVMGQSVKMTSGQVSSTSGLEDDVRMLQTSAPVQGGNSGGPLLTWDGLVVGVIDSKLYKLDDAGEEPPQNVNYAVKVGYLRPLLDDLPDLGGYEPIAPAPGQEKMVAAVRDAVFMLLVRR